MCVSIKLRIQFNLKYLKFMKFPKQLKAFIFFFKSSIFQSSFFVGYSLKFKIERI